MITYVRYDFLFYILEIFSKHSSQIVVFKMRIQFEKLTLQDPGKEGQCREYVEESILFHEIVMVFFAVMHLN